MIRLLPPLISSVFPDFQISQMSTPALYRGFQTALRGGFLLPINNSKQAVIPKTIALEFLATVASIYSHVVLCRHQAFFHVYSPITRFIPPAPYVQRASALLGRVALLQADLGFSSGSVRCRSSSPSIDHCWLGAHTISLDRLSHLLFRIY